MFSPLICYEQKPFSDTCVFSELWKRLTYFQYPKKSAAGSDAMSPRTIHDLTKYATNGKAHRPNVHVTKDNIEVLPRSLGPTCSITKTHHTLVYEQRKPKSGSSRTFCANSVFFLVTVLLTYMASFQSRRLKETKATLIFWTPTLWIHKNYEIVLYFIFKFASRQTAIRPPKLVYLIILRQEIGC